MLKWMKLKNLALVEEAEVEFGEAFNVISGETGAGKSVIMGAVGLLLGERADKSAIRIGADRCEISAEFNLAHADPRIRELLADAAVELEDDPDTLLIRRVITPSSTRNFINSCPVSLQLLKQIGELFIDIHAANENQSLVKPAEQLRILDRFAMLQPLLERTEQAWNALQKLRAEKQAFLLSMPSAEETARMRRDAEEIEKADPQPNEDEELKNKHQLAANSRSILETASRVTSMLTEMEDSISDRISETRRMLLDLERVDAAAAGFVTQIEQVSESVETLADALRDHAGSVELDEGEFMELEERMRILQTLKRRYGPTIEDILAHLESIRAKISDFDNADGKRKEFERREEAAMKFYQEAAETLSGARKDAAKNLVGLLAAETRKLGFNRAEFDITFEPAEPGPHGSDRLQFLFTANPGVPLKPLREVASSGEISRVMLAMKTVLAEADSIPVLVFDEIDANIGGETAMKVGGEIRNLARHKQVICISHLPQVAHCADTHFLVTKNSENETTTLTTIRRLDRNGRIQEIARMLGGGKAALSHAKSMLDAKE